MKNYDGKCSEKFILEFCSWIDISLDTFRETAEPFRGKMWTKNKTNEWALKAPIWEDYMNIEELNVKEIVKKLDTIAKGKKLAETIHKNKK